MKVKIELKGITANERLSEETLCYSATLIVNGKAVGMIANRGCGGCDEVRLNQNCGFTEKELLEAVTESYPPSDVSSMYSEPPGSRTMPASLGVVCAELVERFQFEKKIRRAMTSRVVVLTGNKGEYRTFGWKGVKTITPALLAGFAKERPGLKPLNSMTPAEQAAAITASFEAAA